MNNLEVKIADVIEREPQVPTFIGKDSRIYSTDLPPEIDYYASRLPIRDGQLHYCTAAGIGDLAWLKAKHDSIWKSRDVTVWLPQGEFERGGALCELYGVKYGYMPGLTSGTVWRYWDRYGDPPIPDSGGVLIVSANRHLEQGRKLERWYPELPWSNPVPEFHSTPYKAVVGDGNYVIVAMGAHGYHADRELIANLCPGMWARLLREIEAKLGPVVLQYSARSKVFADAVMRIFDPNMYPADSMRLPEKLAVMKNAKAVFGLHSGDTCMAAWMGVPTFHGYARWLSRMPGMWEGPEPVLDDWCFVDELVLPGVVDRLCQLVVRKYEQT